MNWKSTLLVPGAGVVATWLFTTPAQTPGTSPAAMAPPPSVQAAAEIQQQATRLQARLHADIPYAAPSRNPFRFRDRVTPPVAAPAIAHLPEAALPIEPPRPAIKLDGIASDSPDDAMVRTAILNAGGSVVLVKEGETAAGYRVTKIGDDAVELSGPDGATLRLTIRP